MKRLIVLLSFAALLAVPGSALAQHGGHGGGGGGGHGGGGHHGGGGGHNGGHYGGHYGGGNYGGHHGYHGHGHNTVVIGGPWWWGGGWWGWGYPYPYPYSYAYAYPYGAYGAPYPPDGYDDSPVYIQKENGGPSQMPSGYWYYCPSARAYYPTVETCPEGWTMVPPSPE